MKKRSRTMIVASLDADVAHIFRKVVASKEYTIIVEERNLQAIWDTLDNEVACLVVDLDKFTDEVQAFIKIIKKVRPRLPIITIFSEDNAPSNNQPAETGIFYRASKPLRVQEIEQLMDAIERRLLRESDFLGTSL